MKIDDSTVILVVDNNKVIFQEQSIYEFLSAKIFHIKYYS